MTAIGSALLVIGVFAMLQIFFVNVGYWGFWLIIIGAMIIIVGLIWLISYVSTVSKFKKIITEQSKAVFMKKLDDVEYLAWKLPMKYESRLADKKKGFGLK